MAILLYALLLQIKLKRGIFMARKPVVTRTIVTTQVTTLCIDLTSEEPFNQSFTIHGKMTDDKRILKLIKEEHETDTIKIVSIVNKEYIKTLYGMAEDDFIEHAEVMTEEQEKREKYKKLAEEKESE